MGTPTGARRAASGRRCLTVAASSAVTPQASAVAASRRDLLLAGLSATLAMAAPSPAQAKLDKSVGTYLPPAGIEDFVAFVPDGKKTPSLRAGTVDAANPYKVGHCHTHAASRCRTQASCCLCVVWVAHMHRVV